MATVEHERTQASIVIACLRQGLSGFRNHFESRREKPLLLRVIVGIQNTTYMYGTTYVHCYVEVRIFGVWSQ